MLWISKPILFDSHVFSPNSLSLPFQKASNSAAMQNHVRFGTLDDHLDASVRQIIAFIKDTCLTSISMAHRNAFLTGLIRHLENLRGGAAGEVSENYNIFCNNWIISDYKFFLSSRTRGHVCMLSGKFAKLDSRSYDDPAHVITRHFNCSVDKHFSHFCHVILHFT